MHACLLATSLGTLKLKLHLIMEFLPVLETVSQSKKNLNLVTWFLHKLPKASKRQPDSSCNHGQVQAQSHLMLLYSICTVFRPADLLREGCCACPNAVPILFSQPVRLSALLSLPIRSPEMDAYAVSESKVRYVHSVRVYVA